jgi:predicted regulator of amino acid metabolism with ACT domain
MTIKSFRFPIGCLRIDKSLHEIDEVDRRAILNRCINYHLHDAMQSIDDDEQVTAAADEEAERHDYWTPNDEWTSEEITLIYATKLSNFSHGQKDTSKILKSISLSVAEIRVGFSRVVFPAELFWEAIERWSFREFAVLCSTWAAIGDNQYRRVSFDKIVRGSLGYSTVKEFALLPTHVEPLSRRQVRTTVEKLERRGFFARCPVNKRHTAYSRRLGQIELIHAIADRNARKQQQTQQELLAEVERVTAKLLGIEATKQESKVEEPVSQAKIAKEANVSRQYVHQVLSSKICESDKLVDTPDHLKSRTDRADFRKLPPELQSKVADRKPSPSASQVVARVEATAPKIEPTPEEIFARLQALERLAEADQ